MDSHPLSKSLRVAGGPTAPRAAREAVLSVLDGHTAASLTGDVELIVSELVTNSVLHAGMGPGDEISVDLRLSRDRLRIAVIDGGSRQVPHLVAPDPERPGGKGLWLVAQLAAAWGIAREQNGLTRVWCELSRSGDAA